MNAHALFSDQGGLFAVCFVLMVFSGLLRPLTRSAPAIAPRRGRAKKPQEVSPGRAVTSSISLSPIELALIAELSLEQAREHEAVAHDGAQRLEARHAASEAAAAWRERARILQLVAGRQSGQPMLPARPAEVMASTYTGPERRRQMRRTQTRREGPDGSSNAPGSRDRRTEPERRRRDRRRPQLAQR